MFGGQGAPLPADIQQRVLTGQVFPEDAGALRAAHMDAYAAEADQHRQTIIDRAREATRAREKAIYEQHVSSIELIQIDGFAWSYVCFTP